MSIDQQIQDYFRSRSADASSPAAPVGTIVERGRRRRRRRDVARLGAVVGAVALTGVVATQGFRGDDGAAVETAAQRTAPSDLDWTLVTPESTIGWSRQSAVAADGSVYAVATAPGSSDDRRAEAALYRSTDQREWAEVALPAGLTPSGIATDDDRIYAVGTAASGGSVSLATTSASSPDWDRAELPLDLAERSEAAGLDVTARAARVATVGDRTVVFVSTRAVPGDLEPFVPEDRPDWMPFEATEAGLLGSPATCFGGGTSDGAGTDPSAEVGPSGLQEGGAPETEECAVHELLPWDETQATEAQQRELVGETVVLAIAGEGGFEQVASVPGTAVDALQVDGEGAWAVLNTRGSEIGSQIWHSADGSSWAQVDEDIDGIVVGEGLSQGRAAFAFISSGGPESGVTVLVAGSSTTTSHQVPLPDGAGLVGPVTFGPLGVAMVALGDRDEGAVVVHSRDLASWSTVPMDVGERTSVTGLTVSADAITVRFSDRSEIDRDDFDTPSVTRLFVGTPR